MSDFIELNDEQLSAVAAGGSGNIPAGGITYSTYEHTIVGHYFAKNINDTELVWLYMDGLGNPFITYETLVINGNIWECSCHSEPCTPPQPFSQLFPYVLNIRP